MHVVVWYAVVLMDMQQFKPGVAHRYTVYACVCVYGAYPYDMQVCKHVMCVCV